MTYNTRNESNNTAESSKEKNACFNGNYQYSQSKIMNNKDVYSSNKMWSLKSITKGQTRTSLHAIKYK